MIYLIRNKTNLNIAFQVSMKVSHFSEYLSNDSNKTITMVFILEENKFIIEIK